MRNIVFRAAAAAAFAFSLGAAAEAATFNIGSTSGATGVPGGYQFTVDGITLTVTAGIFDSAGVVTPGGNGARPWIYNGYGMGVSHDTDGQHTVDGSGLKEVVIFAFDKPVTVDWVRFSYFGSKDDFEFFADSDKDGDLDWLFSDIDIPGSGWFELSTIWTTAGTIFGIGADHYSDTFKLKKLIVTEAPEIPLPAAAPLFLAGLAGLGLARRRRARARA